MKKFDVPCVFAGKKTMVPFYIGNAAPDSNPIQHQAKWVSDVRGGQVPPEVMESLAKLQKLARDSGVAFEELCAYALKAASSSIEKSKSANTGSDNK